MLQKQKIYVPLTEGLNNHTDEKFVVPGQVTTLENGVYIDEQRIDKRYGFSNLTQSIITGSSFTEAKGIYSYNNELLIESETSGVPSMYSYSPSVSKWTSKGRAPRVSVSTSTVIRNNAEQADLQFATIGNIRVYVWADSRGGVRYSSQDITTGNFFVNDTSLHSTADLPLIVATSTTFFILYRNSATVFVRAISASTPQTLGSQTSLITNLHATKIEFDAKVLSDVVYFCYFNSIADLVTEKRTGAALGTIVATDTHTPSDFDDALALETTTVSGVSRIHIGWYRTSDHTIRVRILDTSLVQTTAEASLGGVATTDTAVLTGTQASTSSHNITWFCSGLFNAVSASNRVQSAVYGESGVVTALADIAFGFRIATKAFCPSNTVYIGLNSVSEPQETLFIVDTNLNLIAKIAPGETGNGSNLDRLGSVEGSGGIFTLAFNKFSEFKVEGSTGQSSFGYATARLNTDLTTQASTAFINDLMYIAGGSLQVYDGVSYFEEGFASYPEIFSVSSSPTGGALGNGTYRLVVVYEWLDNQGNRHQSAPSIEASFEITAGGTTNTLELLAFSLPISAKDDNNRSNIKVVVYRTLNGGTVFYRDAEVDNTTSAGLVIECTLSDTVISSHEILYTQGGILENIQAPSCDIVVTHKDRLVIAGLEKDNAVRFSKPAVVNEAPGFNEGLEFTISPKGGRVTGLASMDDKLIIFQNSYIYFVSGDGPDALGSGYFTEPQLVSATLGCQNHQSVINTPLGVLFKSDKGIYLLDRGLNLVYIGENVSDFNAETIVSSVVIPNRDEIRLCTSAGNILAYNYDFQKWSVFTDKSCVGSTIWDDKHVIVTSGGLAKYEDSTTYLDNSSFVSLKTKTGWLQVDDQLGLQRIYRVQVLGDYNTPHKLRVKVYYDYNDAVAETHELAITSDPVQYAYDVRHKRQKCSAVRYEISDVAPASATGTGQGFSISGLRLIAGTKEKLNNAPTTRKL